MDTKAVADVVEICNISSKDSEFESDSVDDGSVTSSDSGVTSSSGSEDEPENERQSKTLHFKTKKNQNLERFYWKLVRVKSYTVQLVCAKKLNFWF